MKKRILKTFYILHSAFCISSGEPAAAGFTLIEILIALAIVAITVSVVLEAQIVSLKIEQKARVLQMFRFETQRIFSITRRAKNEEQIREAVSTSVLCRVSAEPIQIESGTNRLTLTKYELNAKDPPSLPTVLYTRIPINACPKPAADSDDIKTKNQFSPPANNLPHP